MKGALNVSNVPSSRKRKRVAYMASQIIKEGRKEVAKKRDDAMCCHECGTKLGGDREAYECVEKLFEYCSNPDDAMFCYYCIYETSRADDADRILLKELNRQDRERENVQPPEKHGIVTRIPSAGPLCMSCYGQLLTCSVLKRYGVQTKFQ
jgi:hypothetical protein